MVVLPLGNLTRLVEQFWHRRAPLCSLIQPVRLAPTTALEFREMLPEDNEASVVDKTHLGRHNVKCSQHSVYVMHTLQTGTLNLQTCLRACRAVQLLSEIMIGAQSPTKGPIFFNGTLVLVTSSSHNDSLHSGV